MKFNVETVFNEFLKRETLASEKILLMVSGGVDSIVLLEVAARVLTINQLAVLHVNHNVRKNAADDAIFVQNLCSQKKVAFHLVELKFTAEKNTESQWRKARQDAAAKVAETGGATRILTAHHATDLVETMIFRLVKGAGPNGLSPFDPATKPFAQLPKSALLEYALQHKLEWREDNSNLNTKFERNLIRHKVLPVLREITPNLESVFVKEANTFAEVADFISVQLEQQTAPLIDNKSLALSDFLNLALVLQAEWLRQIAQKSTSQSEIADTLKWLRANPKGGSYKTVGSTTLKLESGQLKWEN